MQAGDHSESLASPIFDLNEKQAGQAVPLLPENTAGVSSASVEQSSPNAPALPLNLSSRVRILAWGRIDPRFHNEKYMYPIGFVSERSFWSTKRSEDKVWYRNEILEKDGALVFRCTSLETNVTCDSHSPTGAITPFLKEVEILKRRGSNKSAVVRFSGPDWFGLYDSRVVAVLQKLPGVEQCTEYVVQQTTDERGRCIGNLAARMGLPPRQTELRDHLGELTGLASNPHVRRKRSYR